MSSQGDRQLEGKTGCRENEGFETENEKEMKTPAMLSSRYTESQTSYLDIKA